jgi:uncharacterized membrane protein YvbJ
MADSQKSMVSIVAILAIVILVGIVIWFMRDQQSDGLQIEIGALTTELAATPTAPALPL